MTTIMEFAAQYRDARLTWNGLDDRHLMDIKRGKSKPGDDVPGHKAASEIMDAAIEGIVNTPAATLEEALFQLCMIPHCAEMIDSGNSEFLVKVHKLVYSAVDVLERHTGLIRETYRFDSFMFRDFDPFAPASQPQEEGGAS